MDMVVFVHGEPKPWLFMRKFGIQWCVGSRIWPMDYMTYRTDGAKTYMKLGTGVRGQK